MIIGKKKNKQEIEALIPHSGKMCLIEEVDAWDVDNIACRATTHKDPQNPLRMNNQLSAIHLLEYGAQAIAIHGGLLAETKMPGYLGAIRNAIFNLDRIDTLNCEISIHAQVEIKTEKGAVYNFVILAQDKKILEARATVISP